MDPLKNMIEAQKKGSVAIRLLIHATQIGRMLAGIYIAVSVWSLPIQPVAMKYLAVFFIGIWTFNTELMAWLKFINNTKTLSEVLK